MTSCSDGIPMSVIFGFLRTLMYSAYAASEHALRRCARVAHPVLPRLDLVEKLLAHHVEQLGLLEIARVSGLRHEYQTGRRHVALEHERCVEAGLVFVAADDESRHPALRHLLLEVT